jgi:hypothetical protein
MKTFHKPIPILSLFAMLLLFVWACRKEKPEFDLSDKDPCSCASEVSADFDIIEAHTWGTVGDPSIVTDHAVAHGGKKIFFRAKEDIAEYTWYIGSDVETTKETFKTFGLQWEGATIPITLVVRKQPNLTCFPNDDGYDSITKTFNLYPVCHEPYLLEGIFRMAPENSTDSIDIEMRVVQYAPWNDCLTMDITNYDGQGSTCPGNRFRGNRSYRMFTVGGTISNEPCQGIGGFKAWHHLDGTIEMDYYYHDLVNDVWQGNINKHLFGRKIE